MKTEMTSNYYEIALALDGSWKSNIYTYSSSRALKIGDIVNVPFGKSNKLGYVISETSKSSLRIKEINNSIFGLSLSPEVLKQVKWLQDYYPKSPGLHVKQFLPARLLSAKVKNDNKPDNPKVSLKSKKLPTLSKDQSGALRKIQNNSNSSVVLHGVTGSGKTRVYIELATKILSSGKDVLMVYPEISLTTQLEQSLIDSFGKDKILTYHSHKTPSELNKIWLKVADTTRDPLIIIGPRSALFTPTRNLGLVILDEAHDSAFKQDNGARYNGLSVAGALAKNNKAQLVIGSATPPILETSHIIAKGGLLVCMHSLAISSPTTANKEFLIVDMTIKTNRTNHPLLSKALVQSIKSSLVGSKQTLLFLNRRGTARMLLCENCGWHNDCPKCDSPLVFHHDKNNSRCHLCGSKYTVPKVCPDCSHQLSLRSPGTKALEHDLKKLFPEAIIQRFDSDNNKKESFALNYQSIKDGKADIIIGTQLITKGLDLPKLETVGVLQADSALYLPDFSSQEKLFQQLTQVSGRVGRGHTPGRVIIQTYQADNPIFDLVKNQDWHKFYMTELKIRKSANYPPYVYLARLWNKKKSQTGAKKSITNLASSLKSYKNINILGPAPSFHEKANNTYSWQLVIKSSSRRALANIVANLPKDISYDLDPVNLL